MPIPIIAGFILGMLSAFFFALYMLPQKFGKVDHTTYIWSMGIGVLHHRLARLSSSCISSRRRGRISRCPATGGSASWPCSAAWSGGSARCPFAAAIQHIGLALATPFKNTTGIIGTLVGLLALSGI